MKLYHKKEAPATVGPAIDRRGLLGSTGAAALVAGSDGALAQVVGIAPMPPALLWVGAQPDRVTLDDAPAYVAAYPGHNWFDSADVVARFGRAAGAGAACRLVQAGEITVGVASPVEFLLAMRQGLGLISIAQHVWRDGSLIGVPRGSLGTPPDPTRLKAYLAGLSLNDQKPYVGAETWLPSARLLLRRFGIVSTEPLVAGAGWARNAVERGAAFGWLGLTPLWQDGGLDLEAVAPPGALYPGACLVVQATDLQDENRRDRLVRFLRGWAMGLDFALHNVAAAVQLVEARHPGIVQEGREKLAVRRLAEALDAHCPGPVVDDAWGRHDRDAWRRLADEALAIGLLDQEVDPEPALIDNLLDEALSFDRRITFREARRFPLADRFRNAFPG